MKVLLLACALAVSACVAAAVFAAEPFGEPPQLDQLQAGYYRLKIGKIAQFEDPSIAVAFDVDQKAAAATRQKTFADAAKGGYFVAFDHMYFPGVGRIKKESVGYRWLPLPYINDSPRS
jgi:hypothetical protein